MCGFAVPGLDRLLLADGSEGPLGLSVSTGSASPAPTWVLAGGTTGSPTAISVYNPSTEDAIVDVELRPEAASTVTAEPIGDTTRPETVRFERLQCGVDPWAEGGPTIQLDAVADNLEAISAYVDALASSEVVPELRFKQTGNRSAAGGIEYRLETAETGGGR